MARLAGILILAALIVAAGTLFGNEYAPEAMHEEAAAEAEHTEGEGEAAAEEEDEDTSTGQVAGAVLISIGAVALVPLTAPFAGARRREEDAAAEIPAGLEPSLAGFRAALALLSVGAAVIHFAVIAQHLDEWWLTGMFFIVVALFQLGWAVAIMASPSRDVYAVGAVMNALVVITWIVSRTTGVPVGPDAGEPEDVGFPDVLATTFEVLLVVIAAAVLVQAPAAMRQVRPATQATVSWITAVAVAALTALTLALLP